MGRILMFACEPGPATGGYGDRIVGLVGVRAMAKKLGRTFRILWTRDDLRPYFDYSDFDHQIQDPVDGWVREVRLIDGPGDLANHLSQSSLVLSKPGDISRKDLLGTAISINIELAQHLFRNRHIVSRREAKHEYITTMRWAYQTLYSEVLKPTPKVMRRMQEVVGDRTGLVGVQIRAGDAFMETGFEGDAATQYLEGSVGVRRTLENIHERLHPEATVFVTGDHPDTVALACEVFGAERVLGDPEPAKHLDRRHFEKLDQTKLYSDALILAQRCSELHISVNSNFGRVAALAGGVGKVFGLDGAPLCEWNLLSKTPTAFASD